MSPPRTVHVVMGSTGEYSDHATWAVAGYLDGKPKAERHAFEATKRAKAIFEEDKASEESQRYDTAWLREKMGALDPDSKRMDYTGTDYYVVDVPLREDVP